MSSIINEPKRERSFWKVLFEITNQYMKFRKAFTLLELLIVMVILGILFVMLLKTYNWIAAVVFRTQQEKEVAQEILQLSQIFQNFSDRNTIDYPKYDTKTTGALVVSS